MSTILLPPEVTIPETGGDEVIDFDATLAVADTSEVLFTVPSGKVLREVVLVHRGGIFEDAYFNFVADDPATTSSTHLRFREVRNVDGLALPEGDYSFIGGPGDTPTVEGFAIVGPPAA